MAFQGVTSGQINTVTIEFIGTVKFWHFTIFHVSAVIYFRHGLEGNTSVRFGYKFSTTILFIRYYLLDIIY